MKKIIILVISIWPLMVMSQFNYWQQQVNYIIDVSLNDTEHTLEGFEKMEYINNSPDTLQFIWFHIWPNAFKNDKTAFSEQLLLNDRTDFYFSDAEQRGYINRLDFKVNGITAKMEDHPGHIDVIKILLPEPLPPRKSVTISTPFHVKLPYNFSRGGHIKQSYQITQWYPKPAVYDRKGWHPMPYLDQGEFYSEFGNYDVRITLPSNYIVAATGELQDSAALQALKQQPVRNIAPPETRTSKNKQSGQIPMPVTDFPASSTQTKSLRYLQKNVHDFAWFADKRFLIKYDTLMLASGRVIDVFSYNLPSSAVTWKNSTRSIKDAVLTRSEWIGEYPYNVVSAVEAQMGFNGGMEYPTITSISPAGSEKGLDKTIGHEVSHNWLYAILATNERLHPWMDEGMNTFYDKRYDTWKYKTAAENGERPQQRKNFISGRLPVSAEQLINETVSGIKKDQPINTSSENFTALNYGLIAYYRAGNWMQKLQSFLGDKMFDSCMHAYYQQWQFKHPYPEDFRKVIDSVSGMNTGVLFQELDKNESLSSAKKSLQPSFLFNLHETQSKNYVSFAPALGINWYDGLMVGAMIHNYQLPLNRFSFFIVPLYATKSRKLNLLAKASYNWYPGNAVYKIDLGVNAAKFTMNEFQPEGEQKIFPGFQKLVPYLRLTFKQRNPVLKVKTFVQFKSFLIREESLDFQQVIQGTDTSNSVNLVSTKRNLNQLKFVTENKRILYPYRAEVQLEQQKGFFRAAFTGNYYFNYSNGQGGMNVRLFAGKFLYTGANTTQKQFETDRYHLNLSGANGYEDYTYSDYFAGRNKFENWGSQQIMTRDGAFKVRTDLLNSKVGKTDNWLMAANFSTAIPRKLNPLQVLPFKIPVKIFADVGTYAEAWDQNADASKFLFDAGLQLLFFNETLNIYIPLIYSSVFKDYFRSTLGEKRFFKTISFSIDIRQFNWQKLERKIPI